MSLFSFYRRSPSSSVCSLVSLSPLSKLVKGNRCYKGGRRNPLHPPCVVIAVCLPPPEMHTFAGQESVEIISDSIHHCSTIEYVSDLSYSVRYLRALPGLKSDKVVKRVQYRYGIPSHNGHKQYLAHVSHGKIPGQ